MLKSTAVTTTDNIHTHRGMDSKLYYIKFTIYISFGRIFVCIFFYFKMLFKTRNIIIRLYYYNIINF